jgi:predicted RNase H-like nuclease (RuvC/YqgF family)
MSNKKDDVKELVDEISRLMAALEDVNFECQRLEIVNSNLDFQLKSVSRELKQNIAMLETLEEENSSLKEENKALKKELENK